MAWARSELLLAPPLPLLEEQQQGCAAPASRSMSNSSISRDGILLGVNWPHPAVRAHAASRRLDAPSCSHCQARPREQQQQHNGAQQAGGGGRCGLSRRDSLVGFFGLLIGSHSGGGELVFPSLPTCDVFRRDFMAACASLAIGLVFGVRTYASALLQADADTSSAEDVKVVPLGKGEASRWTPQMTTRCG